MKDKSKYDNFSPWHFLRPFIGLIILIIFGTIGFILISHLSLLDAIFMSITTLTTVGYGFVSNPSYQIKIFTIIYILFGVGLFLYFAVEFAEYVVFVNFKKILSKRNMEIKIKNIKDHYIVCGYGRTGAEICTLLQDGKFDFVVIDKDPTFEETAHNEGISYISGDATDDEILEKAGITRAKGIFCALSDDVDNLYLTVSAKNLNPDIIIVTRCIKASNEQKFKKAGANNVILPYQISGRRMVTSVIKPLVVDFLDVVMHTKGQELELEMEQFELKKGSQLENESILTSELRQKTGIIIVAIKRDHHFITNPSPDTILKAGDCLISLGTNTQLTKFEKLLANHC